MAAIVCLAAIIADEGHRVISSDVFRVVPHEFLDAVPKSRDSLNVLVQAQDKAVLLVVLVHEAEGVVVDVTV